MKSERIETPKEKEVRKYPYLGRYNRVWNEEKLDYIMLFTKPYTGIVINIIKADYSLGETVTFCNEDLFTIYDGKVELSNN